jgi:hypothetical protein
MRYTAGQSLIQCAYPTMMNTITTQIRTCPTCQKRNRVPERDGNVTPICGSCKSHLDESYYVIDAEFTDCISTSAPTNRQRLELQKTESNQKLSRELSFIKAPKNQPNFESCNNDLSSLLNEYILRRNSEFYPHILVPDKIKQVVQSRPDKKRAELFGDVSTWAVAAGILSFGTPIGWLGLLGVGCAVIYDITTGFEMRDAKVKAENEKAMKVLSDPKLLSEYMRGQLKRTLGDTSQKLVSSDARVGKYDNQLLNCLKKIPGCEIRSGQGLDLKYNWTPDVILHIPHLGLWIDIEVDEPWYRDNSNQRNPIHYRGKDDYRDRNFLDANWVVFRFSEQQVAEQPMSCVREVTRFLQLFGIDSFCKFQKFQELTPTKRWTEEEALMLPRF